MNGWKMSVGRGMPAFCLVSILLLAVGCGGGDADKSGKSEKSGKKKGEKTSTVKVIAVPEALDDGRLEISVPKNWELMARSGKFAARFSYRKGYPHLYITAANAPEGVTEITPKNAAEHVPGMEDWKERKLDVKSEKMGAYSGVAYRKRARGDSRDYDSRFFVTLQAGRLYEFEIRAEEGKFTEKTAQTLDAVVASAKFSESPAEDTAAVLVEEEEGFGDFTLGEGAAMDVEDMFGPAEMTPEAEAAE